jgi:hypothetical protein
VGGACRICSGQNPGSGIFQTLDVHLGFCTSENIGAVVQTRLMTEDPDDAGRDPATLLRELQEHPAMAAYFRREAVERSYTILSINGQDLIDWIDKLSEGNRGLLVMAQDAQGEELKEQYIIELYRHWHNYVASAMTLVAHVRRVKNKESTSFQDEYERQRKLHLGASPVVRFTQDLRNYLLHYGFPKSTLRMQFGSGGSSPRFSVVCQTSDLLPAWDWAPLARQYLESKGSAFLLRDSITEYMEALESFYEWFFDAFTDEHREALTDLQRLSDKYDAMMPPDES